MAYSDAKSPISVDIIADIFDDNTNDDEHSSDDDFCTLLNTLEQRENSMRSGRSGIVRNGSTNDERQLMSNQAACSTDGFTDERTDSSCLTCPFCQCVQDSENSMEIHLEVAHPEMGAEEYRALNHEEEEKTRQSIKEAVKRIPFRCPFCEVITKEVFDLSDHIDAVHREALGLPPKDSAFCPICQVIYPTHDELSEHLEVHAAEISDEPYIPTCPVCDFTNPDSDIMLLHMEIHFDRHLPAEEKQSEEMLSLISSQDRSNPESSSTSRDGRDSSRQQRNSQAKRDTYQSQYRQNLERSVISGELSPSEYHEMMSAMRRSDQLGIDEGQSMVRDLYENVAVGFCCIHRQNYRMRVCDRLDFYCGSFGDKGWGCGFRNFQMMLSCLAKMPLYAEKIFPDGFSEMPSVSGLQKMIEKAWRKGFDPEGCSQLGGKLVNTRKWIGATEIVATLSSLGVKCVLVDFHQPSADDGTHPKLMQWVYDYFSRFSVRKPPLYLQHQGHSRTIIGVEKDNGEIKLIIFDPGTPYHRIAPIAQNVFLPHELRPFLRPQAAFKAKQYQVVAVVGVLTPAEYEESKNLCSTQVS